MGRKKRFQIGMKQREKRKKARNKLTAKGENLTEYYYDRYYVKLGKDHG